MFGGVWGPLPLGSAGHPQQKMSEESGSAQRDMSEECSVHAARRHWNCTVDSEEDVA